MRKYAYLAKLEELLAALPAQERQDALNYYEEYFDAAGNDKEEQTAAELGDPAEVARKILEEEGVEQTAPAAAEEHYEAAQSAPEQPDRQPAEEQDATQEPTQPPTGPEPPVLDHPEDYPTKGVENQGKASGSRSRKLWLIFWLLVALALVVQLSVLLFGMGNWGGSSASMTVSSTEVAMEEPVQSEPAHTQGETSGAVTYSGTLYTPGKGTLFVNLARGNLVFQTGDQAAVEVCSDDMNGTVSYDQTVDYGYAFVCDSTDPNTQVTITLPVDAYDRVEIHISTSGSVDLGNLQMREISVYTASGPIQSGKLGVQKLTAQTDIGNIWLEKVSDGVDYQVDEVNLQAPSGSVKASFSATRSQWETNITALDGVAETDGTNEGSTKYSRSLEVRAGNRVDLQYGDIGTEK